MSRKTFLGALYQPALLALLVILPLSTKASTPSAQSLQEAVEQRRQLAASGSFLVPSTPLKAVSSTDLAEALDLEAGVLVSNQYDGVAASIAVLSNLGVITPLRGGSFLLISSGVAGAAPEPGSDLGELGPNDDSGTLTLVLAVPPGSRRLAFSMQFLSAEYPEFVGASFNDVFEVVLTDDNGSRSIVSRSADSPEIFPVSGSRAAGSGWDQFSESPAGVDTEFGFGKPDAGLTGYFRVDEPIVASGTVTLSFRIEDANDGLLDSAVLLDNLTLSPVSVVDAAEPIFLDGSEVTSDLGLLARGGEYRRGVVADGESRLVVRRSVDGPGEVEFCLAGGATAPADGRFSLPGVVGEAACVTAPVVSTSEGHQAIAIYRAPDDFNRGGDEPLGERSVTISTVYTPTVGATSTRMTDLVVKRPPLILVHGAMPESIAWTSEIAEDPRFLVRRVNFQHTYNSRISSNAPLVGREIDNALALLAGQGIAGVQADVVAHCAGGLMSRIWIGSPTYRRPLNFDQGNVNRLITLDSPHTGAVLHDALIAIRDNPLTTGLLSSLSLGSLYSGAVDELATYSPIVLGLQDMEVPSHALIGIGGSDFIRYADGSEGYLSGRLGQVVVAMNYFIEVGNVFQQQQQDLVGERMSQQGGLSTAAITLFSEMDSLHFMNPFASSYSSRVIELLNTSIASSFYETFPATATVVPKSRRPATFDLRTVPQSPAQNGLEIVAPASGAIVASGQPLTVSLTAAPGSEIQEVVVAGLNAARIDYDPPFDVVLDVPATAFGELTITALGKNRDGEFFTSDPVSVTIEPSAVLEEIALQPSEVFLDVGESTFHLQVVGHYSDGVSRDITAAAMGTVFLSDDPTTVAVTADGVMTALRPGVTTLIAQHDGMQDSVTVTVLANPIFSDDFESGSTQLWSSSDE